MLTPSEERKHSTQSRRIIILDEQIAALEAAKPFSHLTIVDQAEAFEILADLRRERAEMVHRLPVADVTAFFGDPRSLRYE